MTDSMVFFLPLFAFGLIHIVSCWLMGSRLFFVRSLAILGVIPAGIVLLGWQAGISSTGQAAWIFVLVSLAILYLIVLVNVQNSVSLSAMNRVLAQGRVARTDFEALLCSGASVAARLADMAVNGMAKDVNGRYSLTAKGRAFASGALLVRRVFNIKDCC